jgi:hypothetical protein
VSDPAVSLSFFDPGRRLNAVARAGATLLFQDRESEALDGPTVTTSGDGWKMELPQRLDLAFRPLAEPAELAGVRMRLCRVEGLAAGSKVSCLGVATETIDAPDWAELDCLREIAIAVDPEHALFAIATRPRGAQGHNEEKVHAALLYEGVVVYVEEARLSTVYDATGRQQSAGLELWLEEEDFPRRASGVAVAGSTLDLPGLTVNAGIFDWRMEGRPGAGVYEVTSRQNEPAAA